MFSDKDKLAIEKKGLSLQSVENQINHFKSGFPFIRLAGAATTEKGLHKYSDQEAEGLSKYFDDHFTDYEILKFVPASGAASRMFKNLLQFKDEFKGSAEDLQKFGNDQEFDSPFYFFKNIYSFAFIEELKTVLHQSGHNLDQLLENKRYTIILDHFLSLDGLDYASLPKGLLSFHSYKDSSRLAVEEHLVEGAHYSTDKNKNTSIHLTVSPEHQQRFEEAITQRRGRYEDDFGINFKISFSQQKASTDTIAVEMSNEPYKNEDGSLLFRPGGHGALIENLNDLKGEIVFIKNIDNVVPDRLKGETYLYKKVIGGLLMKMQELNFEFLEMLEDGNIPDEELDRIKLFAEKELNIYIPDAYRGYEKIEKIDFLFNRMNRPMRVCGMVKNEGEPGGGPFWVLNENDEWSLQIVESSQIDFDNPEQKEIVGQSTHFNPVDLVCGIRDFKGNNFDLHDFIDHETGFISLKSKDGRELKALELPGLWNGAMADWITIFVETPLITFNPVKTINDLLRPQHQPE